MRRSVIIASALLMGSSFTLPTARVTDANARQLLHQRIERLAYQRSDAVLAPEILARFPSELRFWEPMFIERFEVSTPIQKTAGQFFGSGCKAHACGEDEAAWVMPRDDQNLAVAVIMRRLVDYGIGGSVRFELFGASMDMLPAPLAAWARDRGMNARNLVVRQAGASLPTS